MTITFKLSPPEVKQKGNKPAFTRFSFIVLIDGVETQVVTGARILGGYVQLPSIPLGRGNYVPVVYLGEKVAEALVGRLISEGWLPLGSENKVEVMVMSPMTKAKVGLGE